MSATDIPVTGTQEEQKTFTQCHRHYTMAREDLEHRTRDFDKKDILFRSHIQAEKWPYRAQVFDPRIFTALYEKTSRILANKPKGRMVPREGGDALGARINNELLSFQWDDNERAENTSMLAKWALMDLNTRKYGAAFGLVNWKWQKKKDDSIFYDGPNFRPLNNRDCLANPSYSTVKNWFQLRDYVTLQELMETNDAARSKPKYKNLDILRQQMREESERGGDRRDTNYVVKNKSLKGLQDFLGSDEVYKTVEVITEYREDRWITFSPKHGIVLRDIDNPYKHGQIPIVQMKYYPIDDDLYGLSEIEPVESLQRALNAYLCQNLDTLNMSTYTPLKVNSQGGAVQMHTLEFGPGKKWLMQNPVSDVVAFESNPQGVAEFVPVYRLISGAIQEALGETSIGTSNMEPGSANKTATEVRDLSAARSSRDNFNLMFLGEAMKKQHQFWHLMNQQFLFTGQKDKAKVIRIIGKDAIKYFQGAGLDSEGLTDEGTKLLSSPEFEDGTVKPEDIMSPLYPVDVDGQTVPKFNLQQGGSYGELLLEPDDLSGTYDYIPDLESMQIPDNNALVTAKQQMVEIALNPATSQLLMQDQYKLNVKELLEDFFEQLGVKEADKYFERIQPQLPVDPMNPNGQIDPTTGQPIGGGAAGPQGGTPDMANGQYGGIPGGAQAVPNGQAQPVVPGSF